MTPISSNVNQGFPQGIIGLFIIVYFVIWATGFILQFFINRRMKAMVKQGVQGLPYTSWVDNSPRAGFQKWGYFLKGKFRSTGDRGFILMCEIYRILICLVGVMLVGVAVFFLTHQKH
jgi:hypothetical protein